MGSIETRSNAGIVTFQARIRKKGHNLVETFDKKGQAQTWIDDNEFAIDHSLPIPALIERDEYHESFLFKPAMERYLREVSPKKKGKNAEKQDGWDAKPLIDYFGKIPLQDIRRKHVELYMDARKHGTGIFIKKKESKRKGVGVGPSSLRHELSLISDLYNVSRLFWGYDDLLSPEKDVKRPAQPQSRKRVLTGNEAKALLDAAKANKLQPMLYPFILLTLHGAMRPSEVAGLQWDEIGWEQRTLYIPEDRIKTSTQRRVPLTSDAYNLLKKLQKSADPANPNVLLPKEKDVFKTKKPSAYFNRSFKTTTKNAGLVDVTPYTLRHTGGTHMIKEGLDVGTVSKIMGHSNIDQTMKYVHLVDSVKVDAIQVLNGLGTKDDEK